MRMTIEAFGTLPEEVQNQARSHLRAFNECHIVYEYGKFHVGGGICLKAVYAPDHKVYGDVYADDVYTPEERICNYIECFHSYPIQYKGQRDYKMLRWMEQMRKDGHEIPIRIVDGVAMPPVGGKFCRRCGSPVWISELRDTENEYDYQCFVCEEDLYTVETIDKPVVEGTKVDGGLLDFGFCDEMCNHCMNETFNIPNSRVSLCAHCGAELFPCATCDEGCDFCHETHGCHRFKHTDDWIKSSHGAYRIGDFVMTSNSAPIPNSVGKIVGLATDDYPETTEHFIIDIEGKVICILHVDNFKRYYFCKEARA